MAFELIRQLAELPRDKGLKRLLLGLYSASSDGDKQPAKYIALSEQQRVNEESPWVSTRKGVTIRRSELQEILAALATADDVWDKGSDGNQLTNREYAEKHLDWSLPTGPVDWEAFVADSRARTP